MNEKTITILDREVRLRYCAATENGFEQLRKKSIQELDYRKQEDLIALAMAAVIAAYARTEEEPPIKSEDLLYDAKPTDIIKLMQAVLELRNEWYEVTPVVAETLDKENVPNDESPKNS